jgi:hypothetical protein
MKKSEKNNITKTWMQISGIQYDFLTLTTIDNNLYRMMNKRRDRQYITLPPYGTGMYCAHS